MSAKQLRRLNGASRLNREAERRGFTLIEVMVVIALIAIIIALLLPFQRGSRGAARRAQCVNNLKQIALALSQYESTYGCLPPVYTTDSTGRPLHSWRALILPYLEEKALYDSIDFTKPWDDPANAKASGSAVSAYRCPAGSEAANTTTYLAVVGAGGCFVPSEPRALGAIWVEEQAPMLLLEAGEEDAVPWMSPRDADETMVLALGKERKLHHPGGTNVAFGNGSVQFMTNSTPDAERKEMIAGPEPTGNREE